MKKLLPSGSFRKIWAYQPGSVLLGKTTKRTLCIEDFQRMVWLSSKQIGGYFRAHRIKVLVIKLSGYHNKSLYKGVPSFSMSLLLFLFHYLFLSFFVAHISAYLHFFGSFPSISEAICSIWMRKTFSNVFSWFKFQKPTLFHLLILFIGRLYHLQMIWIVNCKKLILNPKNHMPFAMGIC